MVSPVVGECYVCKKEAVVSIKFNVEREDTDVVEYDLCASHMEDVLVDIDAEKVEARVSDCFPF